MPYMLSGDNIREYTKHVFSSITNPLLRKVVQKVDDKSFITPPKVEPKVIAENKVIAPPKVIALEPKKVGYQLLEKVEQKLDYKPKQADTLFWCFYILKHGIFKYEIDTTHGVFALEKAEKFRYIGELRNHPERLKMHKIKPLNELEDALSSQDGINLKTFFALCAVENLSVILLKGQKRFEINTEKGGGEEKEGEKGGEKEVVVVRSCSPRGKPEYMMEFIHDIKEVGQIRSSHFLVDGWDTTIALKSMTAYKLEDLKIMAGQLNVAMAKGVKLTKKMLYDQIVEQLLLMAP